MPRFVRNRRDGNHAEICDALEAVGILVVDLADAGSGVPDIACFVRCDKCRRLDDPCNEGRWVWIEIKQQRGRMRASQDAFRERFPVVVARTANEALRACGIEVSK